jgi:hypothetical protein
MQSSRVGLAAFALSAVLPGVGLAGAAWPSGISRLCASAHAVVVGQISRPSSDPVAKVSVTGVIKGGAQKGNVLPVHLPPGLILGDDADREVKSGVVFLARNDGIWQLMPVIDGGVPLADTFLQALDPPASPPTGAGSCEDQVVAQAMAAPNDENIDWVRSPLVWLLDYDSPFLRAKLSGLLPSGKRSFRLLGVMGLLRFGDVGALLVLEQDADALAAAPPQEQTILEVSAALGILYRNPDPQGIAVLARLAGNPVGGRLSLSREAARCLKAIHNPAALPALFGLLSSSDQEIRFDGVFGLASFADNLPVQDSTNVANGEYLRPTLGGPPAEEDVRANSPFWPAFREEEQKYIGFWTSWYQKRFPSAR